MARHEPGAGQYCPISRTLDIVGERWTLLIVRDLVVGTTRFNDLARGLPGLSRSLLTKRLRHLERTGMVTRDGPALCPDARGPLPGADRLRHGRVGGALRCSATRSRRSSTPSCSSGGCTRGSTPPPSSGNRQVIHLRFADDARRFWILVDRGVPSVCMADPGYPVDLTITSDVASLYAVWLGRHARCPSRCGRVASTSWADRRDPTSRRGAAAEPGRALRRRLGLTRGERPAQALRVVLTACRGLERHGPGARRPRRAPRCSRGSGRRPGGPARARRAAARPCDRSPAPSSTAC